MAPGGWRWGPVAAVAAVALGVTGWALLVAAVAAGVWGMGGGQSSAVTAVIVTRGLWADCATDASGVLSCVPLVSLVTLPGYLQGSRALAVLGAALGALGATLGGCAGPRRGPRAGGGALLLLAGLAAVGGAIWFGVGSSQEFFDPTTVGVRFEPGPAVLQAGGEGRCRPWGEGRCSGCLEPAPTGPERPRPLPQRGGGRNTGGTSTSEGPKISPK
ncbi:claudin-19-like isoform X1 [Taeniopygia guttata]|uniref:claudin-19-like isoform X1 n=1 Tax=Taeniopygia guttata TaxID=59729 RepID=UPI003BB9226A